MSTASTTPDSPHFLHYALGTKLGESKNGTTWQAWDTGLERVVVVKLLSPAVHYPEETRTRVMTDSERLCRQPDTPFAEYYDWGEAEGKSYIVREYVSGHPPVEVTAASPPDYAAFIRIAVQAAAALRLAHQFGVMLQNISLSNLVLDKHGRLWFLDYGLPAFGSPEQQVRDLMYLAPEVLAGESATELSDLYSLGVVFCRLLTGRPPYAADNAEHLYQLILTEPVRMKTDASRAAPPELRLVVEKLLSHHPIDRFHDADELAVTLDEIRREMVEEPLFAGLDSPPAHRSSRFYLWLSILALLVLILWMVILTVTRQ